MAARRGQEIGLAIRRQRESLGLSQRTLARRAGVSQPYLSQLETDARRRVSVGILRRLADALGVPINHFVDGEPAGLPRRGRTEVWLYRMTERPDWTRQHLSREVREGRLLPRPWDVSEATIYRRGARLPHPGDVIVLCLVASGGDAAGLCGLGVVTEFSETRQLRLRALPPTETLQATPRWTPKVRRLVEEVPASAADAMWRVREAEQLGDLMSEISGELAGGWLREWTRRDPLA